MLQLKLHPMILQKAELYLDFNYCLGSSGVEQSPEKACVGGANPSRGTTTQALISFNKSCNQL